MDIKQQIETELRKYFDAFNQRRWDDFSGCLDEGFKYFTDGCNVKDKERFVNYLSKNEWDGRGYAITDLEIIPSDDQSLAITCYKIEFTGVDNGELMRVYAIETTIFAKKNDGWKIIHCHTSNKM